MKVKVGFWINELIIGMLLLLPCLLLYTFLYLGISNKGPFPDCQTQASRSYNEELLIIVFCGIGAVFILILLSQARKGIHITSIGSILIAAYVIASAIGDIVKREPFFREFDKGGWHVTNYLFSGQMARALVRDKVLIGKTREEVATMLGETSWHMGYSLDTENPHYLYLAYSNDTVVGATLQCRQD